MFTREYVKQYAIRATHAELAQDTINRIKILEIENKDLVDSCNRVIQDFIKAHQETVGIISNLIPEPLYERLCPFKITGAFSFYRDHKFCLDTKIRLHLAKPYKVVTFMYDNNKDCVYFEGFNLDEKLKDTISNFVLENNNFNSLIEFDD